MKGGITPSQMMWDMAKEFFRKYTDKSRIKFKIDGLKMSFIRAGEKVFALDNEFFAWGGTSKVKILRDENGNEFIGKYTGGSDVQYKIRATGEDFVFPANEIQDEKDHSENQEGKVLSLLGLLEGYLEYTLPAPKKLIGDKHKNDINSDIKNEPSVDIISDKRVVYIMPWYKGREYIKVIADDFPGLELTPLEKVRCAKIAWGCGNAVEELHLSGVVHGDINNAQLKLDDEDNVKIYDFGHSFILTQDTKVFYDSKRGAEGYIAPEVLKKNMYSTKSDDFSLGEILRDNPLYDSDDEFAGVVFRLTAQNPDMRMTASEALPMLKAIWERLAIEAQAEVKLQAGFAKLAL